jgi:glycyl-tRNA synthetase beta chain
MPDFLLEIGCEEIPARMIDAAALELRERLSKLLERERLPASGDIGHLDSPRRLAVLAAGIPAAQPDISEQVTGPSVAVAFKDGQPSPAAHAFAKKVGIDVSRLEKVTTPKGEYLAAKVTRKGRRASEVLSELLPEEINSIYWPKNMYWRQPGEVFVRPVRWLVAMLDRDVIPLDFDGIRAGNESRGHRILADHPVQIPAAGDAYVNALREAKVLTGPAREQQIRKALDAATRVIPGARWREDKNLLDTVVNLTEWPSVILGNFDREFLELPEEVLVTVMRDHQKYFAVEDSSGKLLPHFLAVLNTDGDPQGLIRHGHERVLRARFNDARFFWQTDQKHPLRERTTWLKHVTFQKDLGSYYDKMQRMLKLSSWLGEIILGKRVALRKGIVHKAVCLAKTDLTTELVKEFTELQGTVGGLYARAQVLDPDMKPDAHEAIAIAIYDQYKPESMEGSLPRTPEGDVLSIADKADTIAGMFALGLQPTGSKDPFALRRQANGIVKIIAEKKLPILLSDLLSTAFLAYEGTAAEGKFTRKLDYASILRKLKYLFGLSQDFIFLVADAKLRRELAQPRDDEFELLLSRFFRERIQFYLRDARDIAYDVVNAALGPGCDDIVDIVARAEAVKEVRQLPDFQSIAAACKRIRNILLQAAEKGFAPAHEFEFLSEDAEEAKMLKAKLDQMAPRIEKDRADRDYLSALHMLATLREPVDRFFDKVMVMVEDERVRANRLALLQTLLREFSTIADFSEIVTEGKV